MSNYYLEILQLQPGATKDEIKKAYRRLSKIYHPDLNKSEEAHSKFIELTEAYSFLMNVGPKPNNETIPYNYNPEEDQYYVWRENARKMAWRKAKEEARLQTELIKRILVGFNIIGILILIFNLTLALDFILPYKVTNEKVKKIYAHVETNRRGNKSHTYDAIDFEKHKMMFGQMSILSYSSHFGDMGSVYSTQLFDKPIKVFIKLNGRVTQLNQVVNIYIVFGWLIPAIFLALYLYQFRLRTLDHKLTLSIAMIFISLVQIYIFNKF